MMSAMAEFKNLECLFTNNEEVGLLGANALEHILESKMLLNLNHESDDEIIISCAGGVDIKANLNFTTSLKSGKIYELKAQNFQDGHSGINIISNVKNSIKEIAKFIKENHGEIISFEEGERINFIPKHAKALVLFEKEIKSTKWIQCNFKKETLYPSLQSKQKTFRHYQCFFSRSTCL